MCRNRFYLFAKYIDFTGKTARTLVHNSSPAIHAGLGQSNLIAIVARGNIFDLYANGQKITSVRDNTNAYTGGAIGLVADDYSHVTEVVYHTARVWTIQ